MKPLRILFALAVAVSIAGPAAAGVVCDPVVAVGDLHGGYDAFVTILKKIELIDEQHRWQGGDSCLVQLGDIVDRGARSRELLEFLIDLEAQAPDRVHVLLGNHEIMNMMGDLRYVLREEFAAYATDETDKQREAGFETFLETSRARGLPEEARRTEFESTFPPGWFAHRRAFSSDGRLGKWLRKRDALKIINGTLYGHAGVGLADARNGIDSINASVARDIREYFDLRGRLVRAGVIDPLASLVTGLGMAQLSLEKSEANPLQDPSIAALTRRFILMIQHPILRRDGPFWTRDLAQADEATFGPTLAEILSATKALRIVVAHTPTKDRRIASRFDDRVFVVDTGAGPRYEGTASALEIYRSGRIRAVYPESYEVFVEPVVADAYLEMFLQAGRVLESEEIGSGITRPVKLLLEWDGRTLSAAFKTVDVQRTDLTRSKTTGAELNFTDSYRYERAAYLLDRELGLGMVPVCVIRSVDREEGAAILWVSNNISEDERREEGLGPEDPLMLIRQREVMRVFDALILNTDRNLSNQIYTTSDWKLHLIDHSRTFRLQKELPQGFEDEPVSLPRSLIPKLEALDRTALQIRMRGLLSKAQIKALLARRDSILAKVEQDRAQYGDAMVLYDAIPWTVHPEAEEGQAGSP